MSFLDQLQSMAGINPDNSFSQNLLSMANVTPQSTTLNYNPDGSTNITHKMTAAAPVAPQEQQAPAQAQYQAPQAPQVQMGPTVAAANGQAPGNPLNQPVAPQAQPVSAPAQPQAFAQPIPNYVPPQQGNTTWNDFNNPALLNQSPTQPQAPVQQAPAPVQQAPVQQAPVQQAPAPVQPQQGTYQNMLQVESGNQNYTPQGTPVTSSAGAKYASQVMPSTAANPGFGIKPAQNDSPEEYNRVGREYFDAMRKRYGGDEEKAAAAYNAGPGRVDHAIAVANANGTDWKQYLPGETKGYLQKVFAGGQGPAQPQQGGMQKVSTQPQGTGNDEHDALIAAGNDLSKLGAVAGNPNYSAEVRQEASKHMLEVLRPDLIKAEAAQDVQNAAQTGNFSAITNEAKKDTPKGSAFRAMLYELAGAKTAAQNEYNNLGANASWTPASIGGKSYAVYSSPNGEALKAIDSKTGEYVTDPKILNQLNGFGGTANTQAHMMPAVHGSPVINQQGEVGTLMYDPRTRQTYVQVGAERRPTTGWTTMAQNPTAVQNASAAKAQGSFTGQPAGGAPAVAPAVGGASGAGGTGNAPANTGTGYQSPAPNLAESKANLQVNTADRKSFIKDRDALSAEAQAGQTITDTKKAQTDQLYRNPEIIGLLTGTGTGYDEIRNLLLYGDRTDPASHRAALGAAITKMGIQDPRTIEALNNYDAQQGRVNGSLVRQNLPGIQRVTQNEFNYAKGSILSDVATSTPMAVFQNNSREQFIGDLTRAKNDFVSKNNIQTNGQLQSTWPKEQDMLYKQYAYIDDARNKWVESQMKGRTIPSESTNPGYRDYVNTVLHSFKVYPTPEYNPQTGSWNFGTAQAEKAAKMGRMKSTLGQ